MSSEKCRFVSMGTEVKMLQRWWRGESWQKDLRGHIAGQKGGRVTSQNHFDCFCQSPILLWLFPERYSSNFRILILLLRATEFGRLVAELMKVLKLFLWGKLLGKFVFVFMVSHWWSRLNKILNHSKSSFTNPFNILLKKSLLNIPKFKKLSTKPF